MFIHALRFRSTNEAPWQAWRFHPGSGRFRSYLCFQGPAADLHHIMLAAQYALGQSLPANTSLLLSEVSLQLSDDAGNTWLIHRTPEKTRYLRNGEAISVHQPGAKTSGPQSIPAALLADLSDAENSEPHATGQLQKPAFDCFVIEMTPNGLRRQTYAVAMDPTPSLTDSLRDLLDHKMREVAQDTAQWIGIEAYAKPQLLSQMVRQAEPLLQQYREVCRQYKELKGDDSKDQVDDAAQIARLQTELELIGQIKSLAEPMLQPGSAHKNLRDELNTLESEIAELRQTTGLGEKLHQSPELDFRQAVETLARVEVYSKVAHALERARKYCEQRIEPILQSFGETAEQQLATSGKIASELESCLATLVLRLRPRYEMQAEETTPRSQAGTRSWFERFKGRDLNEQPSPSSPAVHHEYEPFSTQEIGELEITRMATEEAATRLHELQQELVAARAKKLSPLLQINATQEDLLQSLGRHKEQWSKTARELDLDPATDIAKLIKVLSHYGRLLGLLDKRRQLQDKLRNQSLDATKLGRLLLDWRQLTGSQKLSDLSNPTILLAEARDVLRYQEARKARLKQLQQRSQEEVAHTMLRSMLRDRRQKLQQAWQQIFSQNNWPSLSMHDEKLPEIFRRAQLLRNLALLHAATTKEQSNQEASGSLFTGETNGMMSIFLWDTNHLENKTRLEFLHALEASNPARPTLMLIQDEALSGMLASIGLGMATPLVPNQTTGHNSGRAPSVMAAASGAASHDTLKPTPTLPRGAPGSNLNVRKQTSTGSSPTGDNRESQELMQQRAQRALDLLTNKRS